MSSVYLFKTPFPSNDVKISLDTHWAFLQLCGQVEGERVFHHLSHHQFHITSLLLIPLHSYATSCPFGGLSCLVMIAAWLTGSDLTDF